MSIVKDGFLSANAPNWIKVFREENRDRFALAEKLNRFAQRVGNRELPVETEAGFSDSRILSLLLFYRATSNFQGTVLMAERGMIVEARTLARCCMEAAIHIGALKNDTEHVRSLLNDELLSRKQRAKMILERPELIESASAEKLRGSIDDIEKRGKLSRLSLDEMAKKSAIEGVYLFYRQFSADAAHPTISSLNRYVMSDATLNIRGTHCLPKPDHEEIGDTLQLTCMALIFAGTVINDLFPDRELEAALHDCRGDYLRIEADSRQRKPD